MNSKLYHTLKIGFAFALAFVFIFTALYIYRGNYKQACELTFLSNLSAGLFLSVVGFLLLCKRNIPQFLFLDFAILLFIVFIICMVFFNDFRLEGGFKGGFAFLHIVNPLLMLAFYLFFSNQTKGKWQYIFTALVMPISYLIFAIIFGEATGNYIYPTLNYTEYGAGNTVLFIFGVLIGLLVFSAGLYFINRLIHKHNNI